MKNGILDPIPLQDGCQSMFGCKSDQFNILVILDDQYISRYFVAYNTLASMS